ncbi:lipoprotein [Pseudomonas sp. M47T1]|uniref:hypothetical protein n=1 Tax=unclassified Pseudomonas TaxID=196821 RepID=UPI00026078F5|nr:hypothetical protein [Pseudomonas sp. M47T1]EIK94649.1 lipoprotein [Pseudomonas sp. M47T1]
MKSAIALSIVLLTATLAGCAANHPENRPYSAEEQHELALEALSRRGLSFDEYQRERARIERSETEQVIGQRTPATQGQREG